MAFELGPDILAIQREARAVAGQVAAFAAEADECSHVHSPTLDVLRASGLSSLMVPAAHGGRHERVDPLAVCVVREAFMRASSHLDSLFALQGIGSYAIAVAGTDEQREEWLPRVANAEVLAALALTEPVAGSDLRGIETTLVAHGDELELTGAKSFISNGGAAGFYTTMAREGDRFSLVLVPADAPGVSIEPSPEIIAPHVLGEVAFDRVRLPATARLGEPGTGMRHVLATLSVFRISVAGAAVGLMDGALTCAARHAAAREQFGRPLVRLGPVAGLLADSWAELESTRLLAYATRRGRQGRPVGPPRPVFAGQAGRNRGGQPGGGPLCAGDGSVGAHPGVRHRALLPPGPTHADLRGSLRGASSGHRHPTVCRGGRRAGERIVDRGRDGGLMTSRGQRAWT